MRKIDYDSLPHLFYCGHRITSLIAYSFLNKIIAKWWHVSLGKNCRFRGITKFRRYPRSRIDIGNYCHFNSSPDSNLIGVNRPCILSTLSEDANIKIGDYCGFSGAVIGCAKKVDIGNNVRCGANTLITDTDWHTDDPRIGPDAPVIIGNSVWLGVNVTILKGVTIGENTLVATGSVVTRSLPANVMAGGIPAKPLKELAWVDG
jgi:acetyltransferase-like isoleucine patch superfamily enzyme